MKKNKPKPNNIQTERGVNMQETKRAGQSDQPFENPMFIIPQKPLTVYFDSIPQELKDRPQWVVWNMEWKKDKATGKELKTEKPTKVPYQPSGGVAKADTPSTWSTFDEVTKAYHTKRFHGIGYMFSIDDPYTGIDFDGCIDESGIIQDKYSNWINEFDSYTEYSQSGTGVHIIIRGSLRSLLKPDGTGKKNTGLNVEVYDHKRFFIFTGKHIPHTLNEPQERQTKLEEWFHSVFKQTNNKVVNISKKGSSKNRHLTNEQVIRLCSENEKWGSNFTKLFGECDTSKYNFDDSSADQALCNYLANMTQNPEQIDELFRMSSLYRDKWERSDYREGTISKAIQSVIEYRTNNDFYSYETPDTPIYEEWLNLLETTSYSVDTSGKLCLNKEVKNRKTQEWNMVQIPLCNFLARITKETTEDDGLEVIKKLELVGVRETGVLLEPIQVPIKDFESLSWVVEKWGTLCNMEPEPNVKNKVRHAIQELSKEQKQEYTYTHLGFRKIGGKWVYLHAGGAIGSEQVKVNVEQNNLSSYSLPEPAENLKESIQASIRMKDVAEPHISLSLLAMVGLAPLCEPFRKAKIEPAFILWLVGLSGSRKSTIAGCVLNHFGDFGNKSLPATFKDTVNALEKKAYLVKDSLLVIDDFHPTDHERKPMEQKAEYLLRGYGDRVGKERMKQDTSIRKGYAPQGLCIVTGESLPNSSRSGLARLLAVNVDKTTGVKNEVLDTFQTPEHSLKLRESYRGYIEWLLPQFDELPSALNDKFILYRKGVQEQAKETGQHGRINETIAWLLIGLSKYLQYSVDHGAITEFERKNMLQLAKQEFMKLGYQHTENIQEEKKSSMFLSALKELIATEQVTIPHRYTGSPLGNQHSLNLIGYNDDEHLYLLPDTTIGVINKFYEKQNRSFNISKNMLYKEFEDEGILQKAKEHTKNIKINGSQSRYLMIRKSFLES